MTNLEKYNDIFVQVFGAEIAQLGDNFSKETVAEWDSVHQLNIISLIEETFDLMLDSRQQCVLCFSGRQADASVCFGAYCQGDGPSRL